MCLYIYIHTHASSAVPGEVLSVVRADNSMLCDASHGFYITASLLMIIGFTLTIPYLFYQIISYHTSTLMKVRTENPREQEREAKLRTSMVDLSDTDAGRGTSLVTKLCGIGRRGTSPDALAWDYRVWKTRNRAQTLYNEFEWQYRYFRVLLLVHKLVLVIISLFLSISHPVVSAWLQVTLHGIMCIVAVTQRPYFNPAADALSAAASFANFVNPLLLVLTWYGALDKLPATGSAAVILVVNFGLPLICLIVGLCIACKKLRKQRMLIRELEGSMSDEDYARATRDSKTKDRELERDTTRIISGVFMVMCFTAFTALGLILVSYIFNAAQGDVVQATPLTLGKTYVEIQQRAICQIESELNDVEFLYTGSWAGFTASCCCRDSAWSPKLPLANFSAAQLYGPNSSAALRAANVLTNAIGSKQLGQVEIWTCPDLSGLNASSTSGILHKLRRRTQPDGSLSGLALRPFCSPTFAPGILPPVYDEELLAYTVRYANGTHAASDLW